MPCIAPEIERTIVSMYRRQRYSIRACADQAGVNRNTVTHVLRRNNVPLRHEIRNTKTRWQAPPYQRQWSEGEIAEAFDGRRFEDIGTATGVAA